MESLGYAERNPLEWLAAASLVTKAYAAICARMRDPKTADLTPIQEGADVLPAILDLQPEEPQGQTDHLE